MVIVLQNGQLMTVLAPHPSSSPPLALTKPPVALEILRIALGEQEPRWECLSAEDPLYALVSLLFLFDRSPADFIHIIQHQIGFEKFMGMFLEYDARRLFPFVPPSCLSSIRGISFEILPPEHFAPLTCGFLFLFALFQGIEIGIPTTHTIWLILDDQR